MTTTPTTVAGVASGLSRTDRGIVLVGLTFILGVPLMGGAEVARRRRPGPGDPPRVGDLSDLRDSGTDPEVVAPGRPVITLYDDPALLAAEGARPVREGRPPPLR